MKKFRDPNDNDVEKYFEGRVISRRGKYWKIEYEDGDKEDMDRSEVEEGMAEWRNQN